MENPKGYIIYIKNHEYSVQWANEALASGKALGWNLELYEGIDGTKQSLNDFGVKIYQGSKKCVRLLSRPGTQGCFLSQYHLWKQCAEQKNNICIFEHDVLFKKQFSIGKNFKDVIKFEGFRPSKPMNVGQWWEGARAYCITPAGAKKIVRWIDKNGAMPADWCLNNGICNVDFDLDNKVTFSKKDFSFTKDYK